MGSIVGRAKDRTIRDPSSRSSQPYQRTSTTQNKTTRLYDLKLARSTYTVSRLEERGPTLGQASRQR
ncbi:hypothetical protein ABKA04_001546 [Annulohypoxylon sp. FPYF3050]